MMLCCPDLVFFSLLVYELFGTAIVSVCEFRQVHWHCP
jgi:hypothetical protein